MLFRKSLFVGWDSIRPFLVGQDFDRFSRDAFLAGYRRSRPLSAEQEAYLSTFMTLRTLQDLLWVIAKHDQPAFRNTWHSQMLNQLQALREFVNP